MIFQKARESVFLLKYVLSNIGYIMRAQKNIVIVNSDVFREPTEVDATSLCVNRRSMICFCRAIHLSVIEEQVLEVI